MLYFFWLITNWGGGDNQIEERACRKTHLCGGDYSLRNSGLPPPRADQAILFLTNNAVHLLMFENWGINVFGFIDMVSIIEERKRCLSKWNLGSGYTQ